MKYPKNRTLNGIVTAATAIGLCLVTGFDTAEDHEVSWHSVYLGAEFYSGGIKNEHSFLSNMALSRIGASPWLGLHGSLELTLTDLNASVFRSDTRGLYLRDTRGDDPETLLEERTLPTPSHFSGLPDYSYTLYDWAGKNDLCPFVAKAYPEKCHEFQGWMGAMNANHFGTQATLTYRHLHGLSMNLAETARTTRETIVQVHGTDALPHYEADLREMEALAFTYEGIAQHYLQDRWSTGHMWERWNGSDMQSASGELWLDLFVGMMAGLMHGHQSVSDAPLLGVTEFSDKYLTVNVDDFRERIAFDMLSSPGVSPDGSTYRAADWRHPNELTLHPGIGDKRIQDLLTNHYRQQTFFADIQKTQMLDCLAASWADVIRATGENSRGSGYGVSGIFLSDDAPEFDPSEDGHECTDIWVNNDSIYRAWLDDVVVNLLEASLRRYTAKPYNTSDPRQALNQLSRILIGTGIDLTEADSRRFQITARAEVIRFTAHLAIQRKLDALALDQGQNSSDLINLAQGGIGGFAGRAPGKAYGTANWLEPEDLNRLPALDDMHGRDKQALFGLFSRSNPGYWCANPSEIFSRVRDDTLPPSERDVEACSFVADMMYQGTEDWYQGEFAEKRTLDRSSATMPVQSMCQITGVAPTRSDPYKLPPGYVSHSPQSEGYGPYQQYRSTYRSVYNWCRRVPILSLLNQNDQDVVGRAVAGTKINLTGADLGADVGTIEFDAFLVGGGKSGFSITPEKWGPNEVQLTLPSNAPPGTYCIRVHRSDGVMSEGRFVMEVSRDLTERNADFEVAVGGSQYISAQIGSKQSSLEVLPSAEIVCPVTPS